MSRIDRRQELMAILERYQKSRKKEKAIIHNKFCAVCGYHCKYAVRILNRPLSFRQKARGTPKCYGDEVLVHLKALWYAMGRVCSKRVQKGIPEWLTYYTVPISENIRHQLLKISPSTIDQ